MRGSMVRKSSPLLAGKRLKERTRDHFPLRPDAGKARDIPCLATRIDNSHAQRSTSGAVFQMAKGVLLRIGGNCSLFTSKPAHISGHLPSTTWSPISVGPSMPVDAAWKWKADAYQHATGSSISKSSPHVAFSAWLKRSTTKFGCAVKA